MKKTMCLSSMLLLSQSLFAGVSPADGQFAVLKPQYSCEVNVPKGRSSAQIYFSKDCQTAYVLPSLNMRKTVLKPYVTADAGICNRYTQVVNSLNKVDAKIEKLDETIEKLQESYANANSDSDRRVLKEKLDYFQGAKESLVKERNVALDPLYNTSALRAQVRVESDIMDEVAAFQTENLNAVSSAERVFPVRFAPAQTIDSLLAISSKDAKGYLGRSVLKIDFPGTRYIPTKEEKDYYSPQTTLINMNGSMSGVVDISAVSYCSALAKRKDLNPTDEEDLVSLFHSAVALNYDYQVRVQAGVRLHMKSTLEMRDFLSRIQERIVNTAFSRDQFLGAMVEGGVLNNLIIDIDDQGQEVDLSKIVFSENGDGESENLNPMAPLIGKFIKMHLDRIEEKLEKHGLLKSVTEARAKEIQAQTRQEVGGYRTICKSSSSWFSSHKSCRQEPVYVTVNYPGVSELLKLNSDTSKIEDEVTFETHQTTTVRHSSTFGKR